MQKRIDHLSLSKIKNSGQCFRVASIEGRYRFITGENVLYIKKAGKSLFELSCSESEWENMWNNYFDISRDYESICESFRESNNSFIIKAIDYAKGIRILRQDPWEVLITFIISQNKNMPAITSSVEKLSQMFGHEIITPYETIHTFPTLAELSRAKSDDLRTCKVGYRDEYILDAVEKVGSDLLNLKSLNGLETKALLEELKRIKGVGEKVANCIALFGYGRMDAVPKDVWIKRSIAEDFSGENIYDQFSENAGILQQHIFYFKTTNR